jgi:hypothetical protein
MAADRTASGLLQLLALAYSMADFLRSLALPNEVAQ